MALITLIIDLDHLLPASADVYEIEQVSQYVEVCCALDASLHSQQKLSVCVRHPSVAAWLTRTAAPYGESLIVLHRYTIRDQLRERWQVELPSMVSDKEILQAQLCDIPMITRDGQQFWDMLLDYFYGELMTARTFPRGNLAMLLNGIRARSGRGAAQRPLVQRALKTKVERWQDYARREEEQVVLSCLLIDPERLCQAFAQYKLLRGYPSQVTQPLLGSFWETFSRLREETESLLLTPEDSASVSPLIGYYLTEIRAQVTSSKKLEVLVGQMSGELLHEFEMVEALLHEHPDWASPGLLQAIEQRFRPLHEPLNRRLAILQRLIAPPYPTTPDSSWSVEIWLRWVQDEYMPYYSWYIWQQTQRPYPEQSEQASLHFSDWLHKHFVRLKYGSREYFSFNALYQVRKVITASEHVSLVLLIDNFNLTYVDELIRLFHQANFSLQEGGIRPMFSSLPTATEVGKASVLAGRGDQLEISSERYPDLVVKEWSDTFEGKSITYLPNIGALTDLRERLHDIYFLNYLGIDRALHDDRQEHGCSHHELVYERLVALVKSVSSFASTFHLEQCLQIFVLSDHGSTCIRKSSRRGWEQKGFDLSKVTVHRRFLALSDDEMARIPSWVANQCYVIGRERFQTRKNYLAARGYDRFVDASDVAYVHGGLTPEEVVVPFLHFAHRLVSPYPPTVYLQGNHFRYAVRSQVALSLGNPNEVALEAIHAFFIDAEADECRIARLPPHQQQTILLETVFRKEPGLPKQRTLTVRLQYRCQGYDFGPIDRTFEITLHSIMEVPDDTFDL